MAFNRRTTANVTLLTVSLKVMAEAIQNLPLGTDLIDWAGKAAIAFYLLVLAHKANR